MNYVAIDFETANRGADSACSVGLVEFGPEGEEISSLYSLIRPPLMVFDPWNTRIHGFRAEDCRWSPTFAEFLPDLVSFVGDKPLVAHNAPFDMGVLRASAAAWNSELPNWDYYCTLSISRRMIPQYRSHSLGALVADYLMTEYDAHNALSDARMCGKVFARMLSGKLFDRDAVDHTMALLGLAFPKKLFSPPSPSAPRGWR